MRAQLALLVVTVTVLSAFIKNIGALAIMIPVAFQFARRSNVQPSVFLMPMAFGSLIGGLMTQVGTSPNVVVSRVRADLTGESFTMFDFTPVGASLALVGAVFLLFGYRLVPERKSQQVGMHQAIEITDYTSEAMVPAGSPVIGKPLSNLVKIGDGGAVVIAVFRRGTHLAPLPDVVIELDDIFCSKAVPLRSTASSPRQSSRSPGSCADAERQGESRDRSHRGGDRHRLTADRNVGSAPGALQQSQHQPAGRQPPRRTIETEAWQHKTAGRRHRRASGYPQGIAVFPAGLRLPAARATGNPARHHSPCHRSVACSGDRDGGDRGWRRPVQIAFFAAALAMVVFRVIPLRDVYRAVDGPILVMLAALIPVSDTLRTTGGSDLIAGWLSGMAASLPPAGALAIMVVAAMAVTPFLNNAATVLVMAPIAASFATALDYRPDAFLMAVAIGAGSDFLTPIGHQCNTLVMGPGGYRFSDYPRLGLPLSVVIVIVAVPMLMWVWPLR